MGCVLEYIIPLHHSKPRGHKLGSVTTQTNGLQSFKENVSKILASVKTIALNFSILQPQMFFYKLK